MDEYNNAFKAGREAGQSDVALYILKYDTSFAHQIAREYLSRIPGFEEYAENVSGKEGT